MIRSLRPFLLGLLTALTISAVFGQTDQPGSKDYPGISRMPSFSISSYKYLQFDSFSFTVSENGKERKQPVEGQMYSFRYETNPGATPVSALQIVRNFHNAVRGAGGQVLRDTGGGDNRQTTLRLTRGASEIWVDINGYIRDYYMTIVEKQAMQQDVTVDAKAMADGLTATCHVEVPGIFFDTGKAVVKPESDAALKEIPKLL